MADNEEGEENVPKGNEGEEDVPKGSEGEGKTPKGNEGEELAPRGNEWEVVSLTESAYAAAPGPKQLDSNQDSKGEVGGLTDPETSTAMFMSGHFVFPPSQHENLPLEPEYSEIYNEKGGQDDVSQVIKEERDISDATYEANMNVKGLMSDELSGIPIFDEKGNRLSVSGPEFGKDAFDQSIYSSQEYTSFRSEAATAKSDAFEEGEGTDDLVEPLDLLGSGSPNFQKAFEGDNYDDVGLPCEAWWKRRALCLYAHAKEANTFWSLVFAAAVMGLVIIGHRWQQDRWQIFHVKWQFGIKDETMSRILGPITRFKDVFIGGHRRGSLVRGSTPAER